MLKKRYLFLIIIICLFTISTVSAEDNSSNDIISVSNNVNSLEANSNMNSIANDTDTLKACNDEVLTAGNNWYVNSSKNSSGDGKSPERAFVSLDVAINSASNNDIIMIASGEYKGINNTGLFISKNLNLIKYGDVEAIFDAESQRRIWTVTTTSVNITGLTFKNGRASHGGAISWDGNDGTVSNCTFTNNTAKYSGGGAIFWNCAKGIVSDCTFTNNIAEYGGAISWDGNNGTVNNCALINNIALTGSEIYIHNSNLNLNYNWWGSNNPNWTNLINGTYELSVYATLNMTANPNEIYGSEKSDITTKFVWNGTNTDATNLIPKRNVKLSSNGTLTGTGGGVGLTSEFSATRQGIYYVNATADNETLGVTVRVNDFEPTPLPTNIIVNTTSLELSIDENDTINATLNLPEAGSLTVDYDKKIIIVEQAMGGGEWIVTPVAEGNTTITFSFRGNEQYAPAENRTVTVIVSDKPTPRKDLIISYTAEPIIAGENATIIVTGFENATGNVTARIENRLLFTSIVNGTAIFTVSGLTLNTTAYINYEGDDNYNNASTTIQITVYPIPDKKNLTLNVVAEPIIAGENVIINVTVLKDATGNVTVTINNKNYTALIKDGNATVIVSNLSEGKFTANVTYTGDDNYNPSFTTVNITVNSANKKNPTINISTNTPIGENTIISVTLPKDVTMGYVAVSVAGKKYYTPVKDGKATFHIDLAAGNYTILIYYSGDVKYNSITKEFEIIVEPNKSVIISAFNVTKYYHGPENFIAKIYDANKNLLTNKIVKITINGITYNRTSDSNGTVNL